MTSLNEFSGSATDYKYSQSTEQRQTFFVFFYLSFIFLYFSLDYYGFLQPPTKIIKSMNLSKRNGLQIQNY